MDGLTLFLLGRKLTKIGEALLHGDRGAPLQAGVTAILADIASAPGSSISDITARTGFPQSHVSTTVARLRSVGMVDTDSDPADRRRTLVRVTELFHQRIAERSADSAGDSVESALLRALAETTPETAPETTPDADAARLADTVAALDLLAARLLPGPTTVPDPLRR